MESLGAGVVLANEGTLVSVCVTMLVQCLFVVKSLAAGLVLASERPLVSMSATMPIQRPAVMKSFATRSVIAGVGTLIRMPAVVGLEGWNTLEGLPLNGDQRSASSCSKNSTDLFLTLPHPFHSHW